jgi:hypothetical protein
MRIGLVLDRKAVFEGFDVEEVFLTHIVPRFLLPF